LVVVGIVGGMITFRLAGGDGLAAMFAAAGGVLICNWIGLLPPVLGHDLPPRQQFTMMMLGMAIRFLGVLLLVVPVALLDWFERTPFLLWVAISYLAMLGGETILHVIRNVREGGHD
jgi:hypothetical protein